MKKRHFTMTTDGDLPWSFMVIQWEWYTDSLEVEVNVLQSGKRMNPSFLHRSHPNFAT